MGVMTARDLLRLDCGHRFHTTCVDEWHETQIRRQADGQGVRFICLGQGEDNSTKFPFLVHARETTGIMTCAACRAECTYFAPRSARRQWDETAAQARVL